MPNEAWGAPAAVEHHRSRLVVAIAIVTGALAVAGFGLAVSAGDDGDASERRADAGRAAPAAERDRARGARSVPLRPVAEGRGRGTLRLIDDGERLLVSVRGLEPPGAGLYVVWLYRSVDDAVAIGGSARTAFRLNARLPRGAARYGALDISLEPRDGNDAHAGDSVLRAPLGPLRAAG
jgi:hypothetical protein